MPGRQPKPDVLKIIEGNPGKRPVRESVAPQEKTPPDPPSWLSSAATALWDELTSGLAPSGVLNESDISQLAIYAEMVVVLRAAIAELQAEGVMVAGQKPPTRVKNPAFQVARDTASLLRSLGEDFGLSPRARQMLGLPLQEDIDLAELLRR